MVCIRIEMKMICMRLKLTMVQLKVPPKFVFLASLISNLFVVFVKASDKLLNYLMFGQTLIEVKMETLKTHEFHPW